MTQPLHRSATEPRWARRAGRAILGASLLVLGFAAGTWSQRDTAPAPAQAIAIEVALSRRVLRIGEVASLRLTLESEAPLPRDIFSKLRLELACPSGYDEGRPLRIPDDWIAEPSRGGRRLTVAGALTAFRLEADRSEPFLFLAPGTYHLRVSVDGQEAAASAPVEVEVSPANLETVSLPRHEGMRRA